MKATKLVLAAIVVLSLYLYSVDAYRNASLVLPKYRVEIGGGKSQQRVIPCPTTELHQYKKMMKAEEPQSECYEGTCDVPATRNKAKSDLIVFNLIVHVFDSAKGVHPDGVNETLVKSAIKQVRLDYQPYGIDFALKAIRFHKSSKYYCIPPYDDNDPAWYYAINDLKDEVAEDPEHNINLFVSCMQEGNYGTLLGIATFPWDADALTSQGGMWLNSIALSRDYQALGDTTISHELGHNMGLWHTFHGVTEIPVCGDQCTENVHELNDPKADVVGDLCADTPATPMNFYCRAPGDNDCKGKNYGTTDYSNIMGYSQLPQPCANHFTDCQELRMHCWGCAKLQSQMKTANC
jgi:hypothetical protein